MINRNGIRGNIDAFYSSSNQGKNVKTREEFASCKESIVLTSFFHESPETVVMAGLLA